MVYRDPEDIEDPALGAPPAPAAPGPGGPATGAGAAMAADPVLAGKKGKGGGDDLGRPTFSFGSLPGFVAPTFDAPTLATAMAEPGYQFRLNAGTDALQGSAAARGLLRTGGTLQDILKYGQQFGQQEYNNVYNRALQAFDRKYQGAKDTYAPLLARWQTLANAETQAGLAAYNAKVGRRGGGGGGGGSPTIPFELLGPPPSMPDYASIQAAGGPSTAPMTGVAPYEDEYGGGFRY